MSAKRSDRVAAEEVVSMYRHGSILGYRISRRRAVWLVVEPGCLRESDVDASETVLDILRRAAIPRFKGRWEKQLSVNPTDPD